MPPRKKGKGAVSRASGGGARGGGGINALPDEVIHHILGFLDPKEAARTCVLARRWEHLWRSASSLRIECKSLADVTAFLEHVLLLRAGSPLYTFELRFSEFKDRDKPRVYLWVRHALLCHARELKLHCYVPYGYRGFQHDLRLASQHLRSLEFVGVVFKDRTCDFLSYPSLQYLHVAACVFPRVRKISSMSLEHLSITGCCFQPGEGFHTLIDAPSLVSLKLDDEAYRDGLNRTAFITGSNRIPVLDSLPSLKKAIVRFAYGVADTCTDSDYESCSDDDCYNCYYGDDENSKSCVLLKGLSEAEDLSLIAESRMFIFKRDLKQCPTFSKLRTLLLNVYWCVAPDFHELNCILMHSPVLEKLTLHLFPKGSKPRLRIKGSWNPPEIAAAISGHLKIVEVKCVVIDDKVIKVVKFMSCFYISFSFDEAEILE